MTTGINLTLRAYQERRGAELALSLAERDYAVAQQGLEVAKQTLRDCREEEEYLTATLNDAEQADLLIRILKLHN